MAEARVLLDSSIANLQRLASFFADELGASSGTVPPGVPEVRACREALMTISVLIPKLQAARLVVADGVPPWRRCVDCEE
jgi:hypothetical protein